MSISNQHDNFGFIKVAAAVPPLRVGDPEFNAEQILKFSLIAEKNGAEIIVFPELSITGYTSADLFFQRHLLKIANTSLLSICKKTEKMNSILVIGAPAECEGKLFNTAVVLFKGKILGIIPKTFIPGYKEFYEERWFSSSKDLKTHTIELGGKQIPIGADILFKIKNSDAVLGVEICEDLWSPLPPSSYQTVYGANIIANLSASNELIGKADYRKELVSQQSARTISAYIYSGAGVHESTTDLVFGGHAIIAENGHILCESKRFSRAGEIIYSQIDIEHLQADRARTTSFEEAVNEERNFRLIEIPAKHRGIYILERKIDKNPFVPQNSLELDKRSDEIFEIQTTGLAKRLENSGINKIILGLSGGLDSTLSLLVAVKTFKLLGLPTQNIFAFTLPGFGTTKRTKSNAFKLAEAFKITLEEINISEGVSNHLKELGNGEKKDITYENSQARYRTMILMNKSNQLGGLVLGTGDLSEIALGWCTFNGDHISHYNVNASIPKTLVRYLVNWVSEQKDFALAKKVLKDILATPISPELLKSKDGKITQKTEDIIGPYILHDFFLYHFVRWGSSPTKILFLARQAFKKNFKENEIKKWLELFIRRFFNNQWKRSVMSDGPKVGSVSLSPRGDWRMPSDADSKIWLKDLKSDYGKTG